MSEEKKKDLSQRACWYATEALSKRLEVFLATYAFEGNDPTDREAVRKYLEPSVHLAIDMAVSSFTSMLEDKSLDEIFELLEIKKKHIYELIVGTHWIDDILKAYNEEGEDADQ